MAAVEAPVAVATLPRAEIGAFGLDTAGMDTTVLPGDDFNQYASGTWAKNTPIPPDKASYGMFTKLDDLSKARTRAIIEDAAKDPSNKIGVAYATFLDTARIETLGLAPIQPWLNDIRGLSNKADYAALVARADRLGINGPVGQFVNVDDKQNDQYLLNLLQGGLGMPDRDYYLTKDAKSVDIRAKYLTHLTQMLTLAGESNAAARAKAILDYETRIARVHWTQVESRDATKTYNKMTPAQLQSRAPGLRFPQISCRGWTERGQADRRPAKRAHRHRRGNLAGAACSAQGSAHRSLAEQFRAGPAQGGR